MQRKVTYMPKTYIHKPTEIEAIQLTAETFDQCVEFVGISNTSDATSKDECYIGLNNEEGERGINSGDYIIKGVLGKIYPCTAEVFEHSYDVK